MLQEAEKESSGGRHAAVVVFLLRAQEQPETAWRYCLKRQPGIKDTSTLGKSRRENIQPAWSGQLAV